VRPAPPPARGSPDPCPERRGRETDTPAPRGGRPMQAAVGQRAHQGPPPRAGVSREGPDMPLCPAARGCPDVRRTQTEGRAARSRPPRGGVPDGVFDPC